jgi:hypothetical protein
MRTQVAEHLQHYFASNGRPQVGSNMTAASQLPSTAVSAARIAEVRGSIRGPGLFRIKSLDIRCRICGEDDNGGECF